MTTPPPRTNPPHARLLLLARAYVASACVAAPCAAPPADAQAFADVDHWSEPGYGLSIDLPPDTQQVYPDDHGSIGTFQLGNATVRVFIHDQGDAYFPLETYVVNAAWELGVTSGGAATIQFDEGVLFHDRPASRRRMSCTDGDQQFALSQLVFKLDPYTAVVLQAEGTAINHREVERALDAIMQRLTLATPEEIEAQRTARLDAGADYLATVDRLLVKLDLPHEQLYRVTLGDRDVGFLKVTQLDGPDATIDGQPGPQGTSAVILQGRIETDEGPIILLEELLGADTGESEMWSRSRTRTHLGRDETVSELGTAQFGDVAVARQRLSETRDQMWEQPEVYLTQADQWLLLTRLERTPREMSFYSYHEPSGRLALMTVRVVLQPGGRYLALVRRSSSEPEEVMTFDRSGTLLSVQLPDGRAIIPTTADELRAIWGNR